MEVKVDGYWSFSHFGGFPAAGINQRPRLFSFTSVWKGLPVHSSYFEDYHLDSSCITVFWSSRVSQHRYWLESVHWHHCCWFLTQQRHRCVSQSKGCCFSYSRFWDCLAWKTKQGGNFHFEQKNSFNRAHMLVPFHICPFPLLSWAKRSTHWNDVSKKKAVLLTVQMCFWGKKNYNCGAFEQQNGERCS